jgi:hypothetical protein
MMEASRNVLVFVVSFFWELEPWRSAGAVKMSDSEWRLELSQLSFIDLALSSCFPRSGRHRLTKVFRWFKCQAPEAHKCWISCPAYASNSCVAEAQSLAKFESSKFKIHICRLRSLRVKFEMTQPLIPGLRYVASGWRRSAPGRNASTDFIVASFTPIYLPLAMQRDWTL